MIRDAALLACSVVFCLVDSSASVGRIPVSRSSTHGVPDGGEQVLNGAVTPIHSEGAPLLSMGLEDRGEEDELFHEVVLLQVSHKLQRSISTAGAFAAADTSPLLVRQEVRTGPASALNSTNRSNEVALASEGSDVSNSSVALGSPPKLGLAHAPATPTEILVVAGGPADKAGLQSLWWKILPASVLSTHRVLQHIARAFARSPGTSGWAVLALAFVIWLLVMLECCRFGFAGSDEQFLQDRLDDGAEVSGETAVVNKQGKKANRGPRGPQTLVGDIARRASERRREARTRSMGCC